MSEAFERLGICCPHILLPRRGIPYEKWAVVACDQYTSQPEYWQAVERAVGDAPSTLRLMLPEAYLGTPEEAGRQAGVAAAMRDYLARGVLEDAGPSMVLVRRQVASGIRTGFVTAIDLEAYDFAPDSHSLIRATERTITDRLPPRVRIRQQAVLEMPHVMLLMDDADNRVLGSLQPATEGAPLYDFDLMCDGGHIAGWRIPQSCYPDMQRALARLLCGEHPILFAVGDGNHSLATAKVCWERLKPTLPPEARACHPARYALVEVVNLHDPALTFHPIHRAVFGWPARRTLEALRQELERAGCRTAADDSLEHTVTCLVDGQRLPLSFERAGAGLPLTLLQPALEALMARRPELTVDYIHGQDVLQRLAQRPDCLGLALPPLDKAALFPEVNRNGPLQLKTFSMGEAQEKRYYLECRGIQ